MKCRFKGQSRGRVRHPRPRPIPPRGHQETPKPPSGGFSLCVCFGLFAAPQPSFKRTLENVGLPDKSHVQPLDHLRMPCRIQAIPPDTKVLGAYATLDLAGLMPLFLLLFSLIFTASKA